MESFRNAIMNIWKTIHGRKYSTDTDLIDLYSSKGLTYWSFGINRQDQSTVELQWLEHPWNHENMFEIGVVRANEC